MLIARISKHHEKSWALREYRVIGRAKTDEAQAFEGTTLDVWRVARFVHPTSQATNWEGCLILRASRFVQHVNSHYDPALERRRAAWGKRLDQTSSTEFIFFVETSRNTEHFPIPLLYASIVAARGSAYTISHAEEESSAIGMECIRGAAPAGVAAANASQQAQYGAQARQSESLRSDGTSPRRNHTWISMYNGRCCTEYGVSYYDMLSWT